MSTVLKVVGGLGLILWTVGGLVAWSMVGEGVQIVFPGEATQGGDRGASEIALLHEDLAQLRKDLGALTTATRDGFDAVSEATTALAERQKTVQSTTTTPATPVSAPAILAVQTERTKLQEPEQPKLKPKPARKRGFLAFKLPERGFRFDKLQRFEIIPSLSRVGFDGKSTLHDFSGVTSNVRGSVIACLAHPDANCRAWGEVPAKSLTTGHEGRDEEMYKHLCTDKHPKIFFRIKEFVPKKVDKEKLVVEGTATGEMTIRGVTRSHKMTVKLSVDESRRLLIEGEGKLTLTEYKIPIPTALGVISMYDEVKIWIAVRARCLGTVSKEDLTREAEQHVR